MLHLHNLNILHGDLSGGNVLLVSSEKDLDRGWYAKVGDFGLSRVLTAEAISTGTYGTVTHMPPELLTTGMVTVPDQNATSSSLDAEYKLTVPLRQCETHAVE